MARWNLLDNKSYTEDYQPIVCFDQLNSNYSIIVNAVFKKRGECDLPIIKSTLRPPYVGVYFEDTLVLLSADQEDIKIIKTFEVNIKSVLIRSKNDVVVIILENGKLYCLNLKTELFTVADVYVLHDHFSLDFMVEQPDSSIILVNREYAFGFNLLLIIADEYYKSGEVKFKAMPVQRENVSKSDAHSIKLKHAKRNQIYKSSLCIKPSLNKNIDVFCPITNQNFVIGNSLNIYDVKPFEDTKNLLIFSNPSNEKFVLEIVAFNNLKSQFNVDVTKNCSIIGGLKKLALYMDIKDDKMYVFMIKENSPMSQLEILISLRNYEGAELFAKAHNLSPMAVLELKAKFLLSNLNKDYTHEALKELEDIFDSCDNIEFIVSNSCEGVEHNIELSHLLEFSKNKLLNTNDIKLNKKVDDLIWKVEAFKLINLENEEYPMAWEYFVNENAINLCRKFIIGDNLDHATVIWIKSYRTICSTIKIRDIADLLCSISLDTKLNSLLKWLEYFIPSVSSIMPYTADLIITWAKDRICVLENSIHWPEVGIQFAEKFSNLMFNSKGLIAFMPSSAEKVYHLISCMMQIQVLKKDYNIIVSLRDFTTLNSNELAKLILRKAFTEDLKSLLVKFLDSFIIKNNLNHDNLIREYIEELITSSPSIDEVKMEILINCIYNADEKYHCVIMILKSATVPWSERIKNISSDAIASKHFLVPKIHIEVIHADIKTILMKYKCSDLPSDDYEYLIRLIIKKGDADMISDIKKITNIYCSYKEDAYLLCMQSYVENDEVHQALEMFKEVQENFKETCIISFTLILESHLNSCEVNRQLECNYLDFLKSTLKVDENTLESLRNIYVLKNRFKLTILLSDYHIPDCCKYFLIKWCKEKIEFMNKSIENTKEVLSQAVEVGRLLKISKVESVLILVDQSSDKLLKILANIILAEESYFLENNIKSVDIIIKLFPMVNIMEVLFLENALKFVLNIAENCDAKHLSYCIDVCSWLMSIYFAHNNVREVLNTWKNSSFYNPHIVSSIIPVWQEIFGRNSPENYKSKNFTLCLCKIGEQCMDGSVCLPNLLNKCQIQQNDFYFVRILSYCANWNANNGSIKNLEIPSWYRELNDHMIKHLLSKMIMFEKPDHLLISMLMFSYSNSGEWLKEMLSGGIQNSKKINIANHILKCREMYNCIDVPCPQALMIHSQMTIESKLESYGIVIKNNQDDSYNLSSSLELLVNAKSCNVEILEEFCTVANFDKNRALMYYLFSVLKRWNDEYEFNYDSFGKCKIITSNKEEAIMENCLKIVSKITTKDQLVNDLTTLFKKGEIVVQNLANVSLGLYCYEAYIFILELLKRITKKEMFFREYMTLKFLQTYQRITKPKQSELDEFSMKEKFPKIGFYRLPFQSIMCESFWNNMKPEVTLATYKQWLPIAGLFQLNSDIQVSRDMICSNAVKQSMTTEKIINESSNIKWTMHLKNDRLLKEAHECVQNITNLEWAGACFYYVFQGSAFGADQVAAVDMCFQFAEHWAKIEPNHNVVQKMQMKHLLTSSAHVLHKIGLAENKLLCLCDNPHRLIEALYNHESIITRYECTNINNAVDEIAEKHNLNAAILRMRMLEKILNINNTQSSDSPGNRSSSMTDGTLSRELLMKACYILKGTNQIVAAMFLSRNSLNNGEVVNNYNTNIRALQCLLSLVDSDVIEKVTNCRVSELWSKLWNLYFINGLNLIGLEYLISIFQEDKLQTIQQIWHSRDHSHLTISLVIKMMIIYNVHVDDKLLDNIIKAVLKFDLMFEVRNFLLSVRVIHSSSYIDLWSHVLLTPFKRLDTPLVGHQKDECFEALKLLPLCPLINRIDLSPIWYNCIRLGVIDMAVMVLPHLSRSNRRIVMQKIGKIKKSTLQELKQVKSKGIITTNMVMAILKREFPR